MDRVVIAIASALGPAAFEDLPEVRWFFVRYGDPDDHLRVRVLDPPAQVVASIERALDDLSSQGLVWKVLEDRYLPEHRRYGGRSSLAAAERTFWWSTIRATNVLSAGLSSEDRLVEGVRDAVSIAGWIAPPQVGALGMLTGHLAGLPFELDTRKPGFQKMYRALRKERDALARAQPERVPESFVELATSVSSNLSEGDQLGVASSILHMHLNRLLDVEPWRLEPVVVELARRVLISRMHLTPAAIEETDSHA